MQIIYEYHDISVSDRLENITKEKLEILNTKYDFVHRADVFFKKQNRSDDKGQTCSIRLSMPGPRLFATTTAITFEGAIKETIQDLEDQLRKYKEKMKSN